MTRTTVADCHLDGVPIDLDRWTTFSSDDLARIVGQQEPGGHLEDACDYVWSFELVPLARLRTATDDGEEPSGGWVAAHARHLRDDAQAVASGSPEYGGRKEWLAKVWCANTAIYPIYVVEEDHEMRLWDGYRRLAGAFAHELEAVAALVGRPKKGRKHG